VEALHRLRAQAASLQEEVKRSLELLRANIEALSEEQRVLPSSSSERRLLAAVLTFDSTRKKAN